MIIQRISSLVAYMRNEANSGNEDVQKNIEDGHLNLYLDETSVKQTLSMQLAILTLSLTILLSSGSVDLSVSVFIK